MKRTGSMLLIAFVATACGPFMRPAPLTIERHASDAGAQQGSPTDTGELSADEVNARAADVFGDPVDLTDPADDSGESGPSWDIDVRSYETVERVEFYVRHFSGPAKERVAARLERGSQYEPMIRAKLRAGGLPEDMYYLALIESGFDPNAYSRAAAVGMWQFMTGTAKGVGLQVNWWVDERRDPVRSTDAAVRFLRSLNNQFGSLYLAAAAYNGGPGRVSRGLARYADDLEGTSGEDLFFALAEKDYLHRETRDYVPQLIAAALVAKDPSRYGLEVRTLPPWTYDSVQVAANVPLPAIARAAGGSVADLRALNPHILRGMTPPRGGMFVRIPAGSAERFDSAFASIPAAEKRASRTLTTREGQSMAGIARQHGLTAAQLAQFNPTARRLRSGNLVAGQPIVVPTIATARAASGAPDPAIERYGAASTYVVRPGDTLSGIAQRHNTTVAALMRLNGLQRTVIHPGQRLRVR